MRLREPDFEEGYMKRFTAALCAGVVLAGAMQLKAEDKSKLDERLTNSKNVLDEIMATPDKAIPNQILSQADCVVVIPAYKKGAFLVGAQYGKGAATCKTSKGWSAPVFVQLTGGSFGFQIGGQSTDLVLVATNAQGLQHMLSSKFKIGGDAAASAGPVGRNAQAGTDWKLNAEFLTWSRSKGLFAGVDLDGTVLSDDEDAMRDFYGANVPYKTVLGGGTPTPVDAKPFVRTVARYFRATK